MKRVGLLLLAGWLALPLAAQQPPPPEDPEREKEEKAEAPRPAPQTQRREPRPLDWADVDILTGKTRRAAQDARRPANAPYAYVTVPVRELDALDDAALLGRVGIFPAGVAARSFRVRGRSLLALPLLTGAGRHGMVLVVP